MISGRLENAGAVPGADEPGVTVGRSPRALNDEMRGFSDEDAGVAS